MSTSIEELGSGPESAAHIAGMSTPTAIDPELSPADTTSSLERYLAEVDDPVLRENLTREIGGLQRQFGLVFERHHPEGIRLPKHKVKRGSKVVISSRNGKAVKDSPFYRVQRLHRDESTALIVDVQGNEQIIPIDELTVAKEFGDIMYPGLRKVSEVRGGASEAPTHTIINGENYHALEVLQYTHAGQVDLIYIDPPYNTGNADWKYNDRYVDAKDGYRHSKWLSFMEKRLEIAKWLLKPTGAIFISIDDSEQARLKILADQVFGESNFVANFVWKNKNGGGNDSSFVAVEHESVLLYARDKSQLSKFFIDYPAAYLERYSEEDEHGRYYWDTFLRKSGKQYYAITAPDGEVIERNADGSKISWLRSEARFNEDLLAGEVRFVRNKSGKWSIQFKQRLPQGMKPRSIITDGGVTADGSKALKTVLGREAFDNPKPVDLIKRLINMPELPRDAVILDFFGGSGTTAEAVIRLNAEDGGTRQCILVTNNELSKADDTRLRKAGHQPGDDEYEALGVFHHVTKPRIETVVTGVREDGSTYSDGLDANVAFFELTYLDEPEIVTGRALEDLAGLFWLKAGGAGSILEATPDARREGFVLSDSGRTAVLLTPGRAAELAERLRTSGRDITHLFIVTDSAAQGDEAASYFPAGITVERIYGSYLEAFQVNRKD